MNQNQRDDSTPRGAEVPDLSSSYPFLPPTANFPRSEPPLQTATRQYQRQQVLKAREAMGYHPPTGSHLSIAGTFAEQQRRLHEEPTPRELERILTKQFLAGLDRRGWTREEIEDVTRDLLERELPDALDALLGDDDER